MASFPDCLRMRLATIVQSGQVVTVLSRFIAELHVIGGGGGGGGGGEDQVYV